MAQTQSINKRRPMQVRLLRAVVNQGKLWRFLELVCEMLNK